ncbi:MAG TPA: ATP-binding protein [Ktedonobacterales bacterium]
MSSASDVSPSEAIDIPAEPPRRRTHAPRAGTPLAVATPRPQHTSLTPRALAALPDAMATVLSELRRLLVDEPFGVASRQLVDALALSLAPATARLYLVEPAASLGAHAIGGGTLTPSFTLFASASRGATGKLTRPRGIVPSGAHAGTSDPLIRELVSGAGALVAHEGETAAWLASGYMARLPHGTRGVWPLSVRGQVRGMLVVASSSRLAGHDVARVDELAALLMLAYERDRGAPSQDAPEALAQAVLRDAPLALAVVTGESQIIQMGNAAFATLLGLDATASLVGDVLPVVVPERSRSLLASLRIGTVLSGGEPQALVELPVNRDGQMTYWNVTVSSLRLQDKPAALIAGFEVTSEVRRWMHARGSAHQAHEQVTQMRTLHDITLAVSSHLGADPTALLRDVLTSAMELLTARAGVIYRLDDHRHELEVVVANGLSADYRGKRISMSEGVAGDVATHGRGRTVMSYGQSPRRAAIFANEPINETLAVPLRQRGHTVGVVQVFDPAQGRPFTDDDVQLLELLAAQAAQAIENARTLGALEHSLRKLRELDRMKDDLIATASHELRTPLTGVFGFLDLLRMLPSVRNDPTANEYARLASAAARDLGAIAERMLTASRADTGHVEVHPEPVRLSAVVEAVLERYRELALGQGGPHTFVVDVPAHVDVQADVGALREILDNLLSNAVKYSPDGGTITLRATADELANGDTLPTTHYALLTVTDQGLGISPSDQAKLFGRFARLDSAREHEIRGTGLGLYICRQLAHAMGGDVWLLDSGVGRGSVFALSLPMASGPR